MVDWKFAQLLDMIEQTLMASLGNLLVNALWTNMNLAERALPVFRLLSDDLDDGLCERLSMMNARL